jgi:hypothetical protein
MIQHNSITVSINSDFLINPTIVFDLFLHFSLQQCQKFEVGQRFKKITQNAGNVAFVITNITITPGIPNT